MGSDTWVVNAAVGGWLGVGDAVTPGQPLLVLEAMKMQHPVVAPAAGVVGSLEVAAGAQVEAGAVLAVIEPSEDS